MFSESCSLSCRYSYFLYYSLINLGTGELSPRNYVDNLWAFLSLTLSTMMFSIFFSNITSYILELNFNTIKKQQELDEGLDIMLAIELS